MMIGTDIIEISRIKKAAESQHFLSRVFSSSELEYYKAKGSSAQCLAGMFCAKEAAAKALGIGIMGFAFCDIEVCHNTLGAPFLAFYNGAIKAFEGYTASVSIAHCSDYATAVCLLERFSVAG